MLKCVNVDIEILKKLYGWERIIIMKRIFDVGVSFIGLVLLSPIIILISIMIKVTSKGPVFFIQRRVGKDNEEFNILKFRTMRVDTPNVATDLLKNPETYMTPIGKMMRSTSLDELPQLINILKGEMSFVGPRPALYNQYDLNEARARAGVNKLVPGLTGWAQINGRDTISLEDKVRLDKEYLERRSLWFDIKILCKTFVKVAVGEDIQEGKASE